MTFRMLVTFILWALLAALTIAGPAGADPSATSGPRALLVELYTRAVAERSPDWDGGAERETFLTKDLVATWAKVDAARAGNDGDAVLSADPIAGTNALTLKSFEVAIESEPVDAARAAVTVHYQEENMSSVVRYDLRREDGAWRIADIGDGSGSLKAALLSYVQAVEEEAKAGKR